MHEYPVNLFLGIARALGPQLACGFSGNLANLSDRDFGLAPAMTVKFASILNKANKNYIPMCLHKKSIFLTLAL